MTAKGAGDSGVGDETAVLIVEVVPQPYVCQTLKRTAHQKGRVLLYVNNIQLVKPVVSTPGACRNADSKAMSRLTGRKLQRPQAPRDACTGSRCGGHGRRAHRRQALGATGTPGRMQGRTIVLTHSMEQPRGEKPFRHKTETPLNPSADTTCFPRQHLGVRTVCHISEALFRPEICIPVSTSSLFFGELSSVESCSASPPHTPGFPLMPRPLPRPKQTRKAVTLPSGTYRGPHQTIPLDEC